MAKHTITDTPYAKGGYRADILLDEQKKLMTEIREWIKDSCPSSDVTFSFSTVDVWLWKEIHIEGLTAGDHALVALRFS